MNADRVAEENRLTTRFEELLAGGERRGNRSLGFDELHEFARLYRDRSARLARLRDRNADPDAIRHLNALCVRGHALLYATPLEEDDLHEEHAGDDLRTTLARTGGVQRAAWLLLFLGALLGASLSAQDPEASYALMPAAFGYDADRIDELRSSAEARQEFLAREETDGAADFAFGSWLFTHNTQVGMLSFATGVLSGVPTVLLQLYNGMMLGAFGFLFLADGPDTAFFAWLLPHAVPELTAITLCCAGGLLLGRAIALPGRRRRRDALREAAFPAIVLFAASLPLFGVAALTESFLRESALPDLPRLCVAGIYAALLLVAWRVLGRGAVREVHTGWLTEPNRR